MSTINFEMAVRILLKIGRSDIQLTKETLAMYHSSKPHCSSVVTERSPKKALPRLTFYFHRRECTGFICYHIKETLMHFNMASQVNKKIKPIRNLKKKLMNSEVFHEILHCKGLLLLDSCWRYRILCSH